MPIIPILQDDKEEKLLALSQAPWVLKSQSKRKLWR